MGFTESMNRPEVQESRQELNVEIAKILIREGTLNPHYDWYHIINTPIPDEAQWLFGKGTEQVLFDWQQNKDKQNHVNPNRRIDKHE